MSVSLCRYTCSQSANILDVIFLSKWYKENISNSIIWMYTTVTTIKIALISKLIFSFRLFSCFNFASNITEQVVYNGFNLLKDRIAAGPVRTALETDFSSSPKIFPFQSFGCIQQKPPSTLHSLAML